MNWARPYAPDNGFVAVIDQPASDISSALNDGHWADQPYCASSVNASSCSFPLGVDPGGMAPLPVPNPLGGMPYPELSPICRADSMVPYCRPSADSSVCEL